MSRGGAKSNQNGLEHTPWCRKQVVAKSPGSETEYGEISRQLRSPIYKQCKKSGQEPSEQQVLALKV